MNRCDITNKVIIIYCEMFYKKIKCNKNINKYKSIYCKKCAYFIYCHVFVSQIEWNNSIKKLYT